MGPNAHPNGPQASETTATHNSCGAGGGSNSNNNNGRMQLQLQQQQLGNNNNQENNNMTKPFKQRRSFEARRTEVENIRRKFPNKIPVVVERYQREINLPVMDKAKFLVPKELTMLNFAIIIKNRLRVPTSRAFYFLVNNQSIASTSKTIAEIYKEHRDEDGFLYMTYASQEMFGL